MNIVAGREPAYRLEEFYKHSDTKKMFGTDIKAKHITDNTIARSLDEQIQRQKAYMVNMLQRIQLMKIP